MIQDEQVDVVDEINNVLYSVSKFEAHQKGLLHRTVIAGLKTSDGRRILVKQSADRQDAGQYVAPVGGHVMAGESEEDALKREALEEIGITDFKYKLIGRKVYHREILGRNENHYFVYYEIISDKELIISDEIVDYEYFSEAQLASEIENNPQKFGDAYLFIYQNFYEHNQMQDSGQARMTNKF